MRVLVTATDTDAGKTYFCRLLVAALSGAGRNAVGLKPFASGSREDAQALAGVSAGHPPLDAINPWHYAMPAAPLVAARRENASPSLDHALDFVRQKAANHEDVVVEGVGGWLVPMGPGWMMADFAVALGWPVLVVCPNRLGVLNHTLLTLESMRSRGARLAGILLNRIGPVDPVLAQTNREVLESDFQLPILGEIPLDCMQLPEPILQSILEVAEA